MDGEPRRLTASVTRGRDPARSRLSAAQRHGGGLSRRGAGGVTLRHQRKVERAGFPRKREPSQAFQCERLDSASPPAGRLNRGVLPHTNFHVHPCPPAEEHASPICQCDQPRRASAAVDIQAAWHGEAGHLVRHWSLWWAAQCGLPKHQASASPMRLIQPLSVGAG